MNASQRGTQPQFREGASVSTPSGAIAKILRVFADLREVEVEFTEGVQAGQQARFKFGWLTPMRTTG